MSEEIEVTIRFDKKSGEVTVIYRENAITLPETYKKTGKALAVGAKYAANLESKGD